MSPIASVASGSIVPLATGVAAMGTANIGARMMTNQRVIDWLAKPISPTTPGAAGAHLARLGVIYNQTNDAELKEELGGYIKSIQSQQQ